MSTTNRIRRQLAAAIAMVCAGLSHATTAGAVDLRDWGRKFPTSQRFVVLPQFNSEAVLDKETQLVWQRYVGYPQYFQQNAFRNCADARIGGRMGWRLPTVSELTSLLDSQSSDAAKLPAGHPFRTSTNQQIPGNFVWWSSTLDLRSPQDPALLGSYRFYGVRLDTASVVVESAMIDRQFICVRGNDPGSTG